MTTYEEWRVTGGWIDGQPYEYIWSPERNADPEAAARGFVETTPKFWTDGPHLHKRTVTVTEWAQEGA